MEGSASGLIWGNILEFSWIYWQRPKKLSGWVVSMLRFDPQTSHIWRWNGNHTTDTSFKFPLYSAGLLFSCFSKYIALPYVLLASLKTSFSFLLGHVIMWGRGRHLHWEIKSFVCTWRIHCPRCFIFSRLVNKTSFSIQSPSSINWKEKYKILQPWLHGKKIFTQ